MAKLIEEFKTTEGDTFQILSSDKSFKTQVVIAHIGVTMARRHQSLNDAIERSKLFRVRSKK